MIYLFFGFLLWIAVVNPVSASPSPADALLSSLSPAQRDSESATWHAIRRALYTHALSGREVTSANTTSLDKSWENSVLISYSGDQDLDTQKGEASISAGIEVTCTLCYIKGTAKTNFIYDADFNVTQAFDNFTSEVADEFDNLAHEVVDYVEDYFDDVVTKLEDGIDLDDFTFPTMNFTFNIDVEEIPEFQLEFEFDGLEVYMLIDTTLSAGATYTLNLFTSDTIVGFGVGDEFLGVVFAIDLILNVEGQIDMSSGFHLKLDDGALINIAMFSESVSQVTLNGGEFEFLPVTVESAGVVFQAVLRLGVKAGFEVTSPGVSIADIDVAKASTGAEVGVYANIAEFITNVTVAPDGNDDNCTFQVVEAYQLALGAAAGASVAIGDHTWGPVPTAEVTVFYTTLPSACATSGRGNVTSTALSETAITKRNPDNDKMETTTISTKATFTAVSCQSTGMINCPASLQTTAITTTTMTLVTVVPSGSDATFPESVQSSVTSTVAFGDRSNKVLSSSGSPKSYVPPSPTSTQEATSSSIVDNIEHGKTGGVPNRVILGVSIGLGVPVLLGLIGAFIVYRRRKGSMEGPKYDPVSVVSPSAKTPGVSIINQPLRE